MKEKGYYKVQKITFFILYPSIETAINTFVSILADVSLISKALISEVFKSFLKPLTQCLGTLTVRRYSLMSNLNLPC